MVATPLADYWMWKHVRTTQISEILAIYKFNDIDNHI